MLQNPRNYNYSDAVSIMTIYPFFSKAYSLAEIKLHMVFKRIIPNDVFI